MKNLTPSVRLKVKRDTFFIPDPAKGVYFRNNVSSFRMEGSMIDQWVQKLMPMFNGKYSLGELTAGLPGPHRDRVFEIAEVLYRNGFVRDVSQDYPHQLEEHVLKKYSSQIEFLESFGDSGAYRFQAYRQAKVLAAGSGSIFVSLVSALIESGLPKVHMVITDPESTNTKRLKEIVAHACETDPEVSAEEAARESEEVHTWEELIQPYDSILYVSEAGNVEELQVIHAACRKEKKIFLPAIFHKQAGMAGPLVHPESEGCWESAWHRVHQSAFCEDKQLHTISSTAGAMLANLIVFELFKEVTGLISAEQRNQFFLLNLETLEGNWHSYLPHPMLTGNTAVEWIPDVDQRIGQSSSSGRKKSDSLFLFFSQLTSKESGIFHKWEEGDLKQLPLAQCGVQAADPLSKGPAELLPAIICTDLRHDEARREAGLTGIEAYVSRMAGRLELSPNFDLYGIGAGETFAEGVLRGLDRCLEEKLAKSQANQRKVTPIQLSAVEDERCRFYLDALTALEGAPKICQGEGVSGFPVVWVGTNNDRWFGSVGFNRTLALRKALQHAIAQAQNHSGKHKATAVEASSVLLEEEEPQRLVIPPCNEKEQSQLLQSARQVLEENSKKLLVCEFSFEPFLKESLAGVFGVFIREEESN
ncbi:MULTISPECIES: putative thiazole-containing bacteriocin maturation protein [Cytobacillus]|uniref:putative thiazole-containing bacteriocin maturation protein n=1 Tax=Cytobacillus TaxID=2675230 RepID=UPI00203E35FB|nr:putative thiazole-containing bacteriocin maturation protein [Cytobacillus oceanisediminis]MCM3243231.1 putative thiazole-containing bacteriocin maturation protein [Cytobacillus oceanisediminis]MDK7665476.1 putative thiazole-containing bacteriocin maturation protein [Cytobacillus oceanisediminis]